jgi:hypothetical protein
MSMAGARSAVLAPAVQLAAGPRTARLQRQLAGKPWPALSFADVVAAPGWLGDAAQEQALALRAGLWLASPRLAASIDGAALRALADAAGEAALDWALAAADDAAAFAGPAVAETALTGPALAALGRGALAATLAPALAARLAATGPAPLSPAACIAARAAAQAVP